jgi:hypothetical protein
MPHEETTMAIEIVDIRCTVCGDQVTSSSCPKHPNAMLRPKASEADRAAAKRDVNRRHRWRRRSYLTPSQVVAAACAAQEDAENVALGVEDDEEREE